MGSSVDTAGPRIHRGLAKWAEVTRSISPDARFRHPAFRSLGGNLAFALRAALCFLRRSIGTGNPSEHPEVMGLYR